MSASRIDGLVDVVVESNRNANGMSLGSTLPERHERNIDTTTPAVPAMPSTMPGPTVGRHDARSVRRSRRETGALPTGSRATGIATLLLLRLPVPSQFPTRHGAKPSETSGSFTDPRTWNL